MSWKVHTSIQKLRAIDIDRTHNNKLSLKSEEIVTFWWGIFLTFSLGKVLCTYVKSYSVLRAIKPSKILNEDVCREEN